MSYTNSPAQPDDTGVMDTPDLITSFTTWQAWVDSTPAPALPANILHVRGEVEIPVPGFQLKLDAAVLQDINPSILVLELILQESEQGQAGVYSPQYRQSAIPDQFSRIRIQIPGAEDILINEIFQTG
ncbi:MAG: hypothetical protein KDI44_16255 [Thiothrix sp.]|nr:hypothetical protein [Thiothrix sp.]HPQ94328.1 hypothetical protein [Thiolinea sp.]